EDRVGTDWKTGLHGHARGSESRRRGPSVRLCPLVHGVAGQLPPSDRATRQGKAGSVHRVGRSAGPASARVAENDPTAGPFVSPASSDHTAALGLLTAAAAPLRPRSGCQQPLGGGPRRGSARGGGLGGWLGVGFSPGGEGKPP